MEIELYEDTFRIPRNEGHKITEASLRSMNMGRRFWEADIASLAPYQKDAIGPYLDTFKSKYLKGQGLYIWGKNGVGKTHVASVLCKHTSTELGLPSYQVTVDEYREALDVHVSGAVDTIAYPDSDQTLLYRMKHVAVLIIDDLGKEHRSKSGYFEKKLGSLLRYRSKEMIPTIITSNLSFEEFYEVYGKSTAEIIRENSHIVQLKGPNVREEISNRA